MELRRKLTILAEAARYDASCASSGSNRKTPEGGLGKGASMGICHSYTPDGRCVSLLKLLLTNRCAWDCVYCPNRSSSDVPRAELQPDEVVKLTLDFYRRNLIEGLFLSSGVLKDAQTTMERVIEVARSLREDHKFGGYIHLKVVPGAAREQIALAGRYADRVSANIELPTQRDLETLAPQKELPRIETAMAQIQDLREEIPRFARAGQSTQMVIGASPATEAEILQTSARLSEKYQLRRVYYSAYSPIPHADPRLPPEAPPLVREHRLYQADWLLRFYGFEVSELIEAGPQLELEIDPKLSWALRHREAFPVDLNRAAREQLLRVPGLGTRTVKLLLTSRRHRRIRLEDLARLRVSLKKVMPFVIADGHSPRGIDSPRLRPKQLSLL